MIRFQKHIIMIMIQIHKSCNLKYLIGSIKWLNEFTGDISSRMTHAPVCDFMHGGAAMGNT